MGVDVKTAKKHIRLQRGFQALVKKLEKHDDFAESVMAANYGDDVEVYFKNKVPDEFDRDIEVFKKKMKVNVQKKTTKKSRKEMERLAATITKHLKNKDFKEIGYVIDVDNLQVSAIVGRGNAEDDMKDEEINLKKLEEKARKILEKDLDAEELDGVGLFLTSESNDGDEHTRGGRRVYNPNGCTSGFSVVNVFKQVGKSYQTGIATAGHCHVTRYDTEQAGESDYPMTFQQQHIGSWGDFEWHTTSHWELPEYFAGPLDLRDVKKVGTSFSKNDWVCVNSRMRSERFCDQIAKTSVSHNGASRLVAMKHHPTRSGDSGGPWSHGFTADGIHKGYKSWWEYCGFLSWCKRTHSTWSRVMYLPVAIPGVNILLHP